MIARDVSHCSFHAQKDDSRTGRERELGAAWAGLSLRHCNRVAVAQKFNTERSGENAAFASINIKLNFSALLQGCSPKKVGDA